MEELFERMWKNNHQPPNGTTLKKAAKYYFEKGLKANKDDGAEVPCNVGLSATVDGMDNVEYFICRLIDQCEGEIITEEFLHRRYADFVKWHGQKGR